MSLTDLIYLSQKSLRSNILRSVLTSLGIIIEDKKNVPNWFNLSFSKKFAF